MLAQRNPQMKKAVGILKELSADERTRMLYEESEIARRDMISRMDGAVKQREIEFAWNMILDREPNEKIMRYTKLTFEEVEELRNELEICC